MSVIGILVILGCVVAGYWLVSSVMGDGVDVMEEGRKAEEHQRQSQQDQLPSARDD